MKRLLRQTKAVEILDLIKNCKMLRRLSIKTKLLLTKPRLSTQRRILIKMLKMLKKVQKIKAEISKQLINKEIHYRKHQIVIRKSLGNLLKLVLINLRHLPVQVIIKSL